MTPIRVFALAFFVALGFLNSQAQSAKFYALYFDGNSALVKGQSDKAIDFYNQALKIFQADYVYFNRGNAFFDKKDWKSALADYDKTLSLNKTYAEAFCQRGLVKLQLSDPGACDDFKKAIKGGSEDAKTAYEKNCKKK